MRGRDVGVHHVVGSAVVLRAYANGRKNRKKKKKLIAIRLKMLTAKKKKKGSDKLRENERPLEREIFIKAAKRAAQKAGNPIDTVFLNHGYICL